MPAINLSLHSLKQARVKGGGLNLVQTVVLGRVNPNHVCVPMLQPLPGRKRKGGRRDRAGRRSMSLVHGLGGSP